ncbi:ATP-binding protein [Prevotella sp. P2-180]|uniref:ATP-binding protein n=1 Tax=Prevotella sp. P2-180 TaxID=2024224 RepID=UPI000B964761|nr:ATP-binding protein [Prevotella sp. P2-180]OYP66600.1 AAA family ATPase [Prevotella sp. P2-180]
METKRLKRLPVGIQTFSNIIEDDMLYIDKTEYIWNMIHLSKYIFLSRPRWFGKSLLVSTLQAYFEGRKDLFKGLFIETVEKNWTEYPVLRFSMASGKHMEKDQLERYLLYILEENERRFGITSDSKDPNVRLKNLIASAYEKTGKKVVVLIDEYDAPLLDVVHEEQNLPVLRNVMRNFYSPLKDCDPYLQFVFLTGITKFSQLSIFSELNNLKNISMRPDYAGVCGITKEEMITAMSDYIDDFAEAQEITREEAIEGLKLQYDGYHFTWPSPDVFNPFSLLNAFQDHDYTNYWFGSGTPTYLIEMLRKFHVVPSDMNKMQTLASDFDAPTENMASITPLLYQSGYVTIKDFNRATRLYTLDIPNTEIRVGLMDSLLPNYVSMRKEAGNTTIAKMYLALLNDNLDEMFSLLQTYLLTVPYCDNANSEGHYQQLLYVIFSLFGRYVEVEVHTPTGRVDIVMKTDKALYLFELKLNMSAQAAMKQIDLKNYASKFALSGLPIVKVGINFDPERRTIGDWKVEG